MHIGCLIQSHYTGFMKSSYSELPNIKAKKLLKLIQSDTKDYGLDSDKTKVLKQSLKFTSNWERVICEDYTSLPYKKIHFLLNDDNIYPLHYTPDPYTDNNFQLMNVQLDENTVTAYLSFYLTYYLSSQNKLKVINHVDDIEWQEDLPPMTRKSLEKDLSQYPKVEKTDNFFTVTAPCLFRLSIMEIIFLIRDDGQLQIKQHKLLIDDLPAKSFP